MRNYARLNALLGPARVKDIIFTARLVEAEEGRAIGLYSELARAPVVAIRPGQRVRLTLVLDPRGAVQCVACHCWRWCWYWHWLLRWP